MDQSLEPWGSGELPGLDGWLRVGDVAEAAIEQEVEQVPDVQAGLGDRAASEAAEAQAGPEAIPVEAQEPAAAPRSAGVRGDDPWPVAGRKVMRLQLARFLARAPGVIAGEDPEDVRAMRVASRRLRAAWRVFGDAFEPRVVRRFRGDLSGLGRELGAVRDVDVRLATVAHHAGHRSRREAGRLDPLLAAWRAERTLLHRQLVETLRSEWFAVLTADHEAFVESEAHVRPGADLGQVRHYAPASAWIAFGRLRAFEPALPAADLLTLHEVRIAAKWFRYTLEAVREPIEVETVTLVRRVVALQDLLGDVHDLHVAATDARRFLAERPGLRPAERAAIERFAGRLDERVESLARRVGPTWRPIGAPGYRRALGQAMAGL